MKSRLIKIGTLTIGLGIILFVAGCKKFLEENPDRRTEINTVDKLSQLLVSAYPDRNYFTIAETVSDNVEDKSAPLALQNNEPYISLYNWNVPEGSETGTPAEYWNSCYRAIANANAALEAIEQNNFGTAGNQYKGEALLARAYAQFMLVTFFADAYEIGGANNGMGVPYPLESETTTRPNYERGTVASNYAQIRKDLEEGLPLLKSATYQVPHYHFTEQAASVFASRFYLFTGDWDKVVASVNGIYTDGNFKTKIRQYTGELYPLSYDEYRIAYTKAEKPWNLLLASTYSFYQRGSGGAGFARYSLGENVKTYYGAATVFGASFRNRYGIYSSSPPNYTTNKFNEYFYVTNVQASTGRPYIMAPILTADEALLNRDEAYIRLAKEKGDVNNYTLAINDLNDFASTRIVNYVQSTHGLSIAKAKTYFAATDDYEAMIQALLQTKRIAFMQEGMRWMDILRHKLTVTHNFIAADGTETFKTLAPGDKKRVFQIPQDAINAGMTPNPR
jgi:hypothetical protein